MRKLTRRTHSRALAAVASVAAVILLAPASPGIANPQDDKASIDERVEELQREHEGLSEDLARVVAELEEAEDRMPDAEDAVTAASDELSEAQRKDDELAARLTSAENAEKALQTEIDDGTDQIEES